MRLSASADSEWVHVHVVDQGRGMDADARAGVFRRLWTAAPGTKPVGGAGIGLAIAHRLVTSDGGEIELDEAPGGGVDAHGRLRPATRTGVRGGRTRDEPLPVSSLAATGPERD